MGGGEMATEKKRVRVCVKKRSMVLLNVAYVTLRVV